ncbi:hypothetical protein GV792_04735 [Nocardia cyriacigeorgica]|uniref:hypothetical protein n=1 Tax=Nocardia cyriacigeorgica TaxID=135487 RepID=UPI0013B6D46E|nr:hypothetical protein [Nocardia cyriacigeorgica]NEW49349.1 hypothetical protein [Nocardia cyriacigeorgica]
MASTPETIKADILIQVHGSEPVNVATVELPVVHKTTTTHIQRIPDYSPIADAGKAIADELTKASDGA